MPLDSTGFFENGNNGSNPLSLNDVLKMLDVHTFSSIQLMIYKSREQIKHKGNFWYQNRLAIKVGLIICAFLNMLWGMQFYDTNLLACVGLIWAGFCSITLMVAFEPTLPPVWNEYNVNYIMNRRIPNTAIDAYDRIRKYLPNSYGVVGNLSDIDVFATYLVIKCDNDEAVIGFWRH